uniref:Uncharacterized protein n=1 Tax=Drosophila melanogaster TaxID=7227 RepID=M9NEL0_DROME|nr:uncharacterized protein Dmel_CG43052 [Drosophila melanogaster]AFH03704.1 uncharacterized protein Dmel_CG43052 [Drosophila melanogaster]|eukprot:NP_001246030.1 uncharacterized protein Dmel_CG43052 [Drosophila melanogaster]
MGAEQSALLACTQTGIHEDRLEMDNSKLFFQLYFDRMPQPVTGPVTEALLHLVDKVNVAGANNADETQSIKDECNSGESDTISVLSNDSEVSTPSLDVEIEPIQIAEFEPIDQYNMPIEETDQTYTLPLLK